MLRARQVIGLDSDTDLAYSEPCRDIKGIHMRTTRICGVWAAVLALVLAVAGCESDEGGIRANNREDSAVGDSAVGDTAEGDVETGDVVDSIEPVPAEQCFSDGLCADDSDCSQGVRCNRALVPPHCQELYCGPVGSLCDQDVLCEYGMVCAEQACCRSACEGRVCGDDGCGGTCGACADAQVCTPAGACCEPDCGGKVCGDDSCGGSCGACDEASVCTANGRCEAGEARLVVVPALVDFGSVAVLEEPEEAVQLMNTGSLEIVLEGLRFDPPSPNVTVTLGSVPYVSTSANGVVALVEALRLPPGSSVPLTVTFRGETQEPSIVAISFLSVVSNEVQAPGEPTLTILANTSGACIQVVPEAIAFGGKVPGQQYLLPLQVGNCSSSAVLEIYRIGFMGGMDEAKGNYQIVIPADLNSGKPPSPESPILVNPNQTILFDVVYAPQQEAEVSNDGQPVKETEVLVVESNGFIASKEIPVSGFGIADTCPVAVIQIEEGEEVIPQTILHVHGENSYSNAGNITKYEWTVEQPALSASVFVPTESYPTPSFEANVAGKYIFRLDVWDEYGRKSCFSHEAVVFVVPDEAVHVELLWTSPGDSEPLDEGPLVGTDLDLHFAHPNAVQFDLDGDGVKDPWFDPSWDTFWYYPLQNWGSATSNEDNPSLDRDDVDTNGPENINLDTPEDGMTYRIGVNYWDDHGFGTSFATVRVYVYAQLVFEVKDVALYDHDMWWVANIDWPSGQVNAKMTDAESFWVTHDYHHPQFYQP